MKKKVMKNVFMIVVTITLLFVPLSLFLGYYVMYKFLSIVDFILLSSLLISMIKILLDALTD